MKKTPTKPSDSIDDDTWKEYLRLCKQEPRLFDLIADQLQLSSSYGFCREWHYQYRLQPSVLKVLAIDPRDKKRLLRSRHTMSVITDVLFAICPPCAHEGHPCVTTESTKSTGS